MGFVLSIDVGTTNIKAALVDEDGRIAGPVRAIAMEMERCAAGKAEHDPHKLRQALMGVCKLAVGSRGAEVDLVSLTSYQFGLVLVDANGNPLTKISTFADTTAQSHHATFLQAIGHADQVYLRTGCPPIFQYPVNRLHHIATTNPGLKHKVAHVLDSKAFLMHALTGEYFTDFSTAGSLGCLDVSGHWDKPIIEAAGFDVDQFPTVLNGFADKVRLKASVCTELGLKQATEISAGLYDGAAMAASLTGFEPDIAVGNFGTSGMFRVPTASPVADFATGMIQSYLLRPGAFFTGSGISNCTIASDLLLSILGAERDYLEKTELSVPGANGVMTFPYFTGERDQRIGNIATGVVIGLGIASTRDDLARSFLEGVAFSFLLAKSRLDATVRIKELRLGGGATANTAWMQIMADVLNLPIRVTQDPEMGIIGAACLARHGEAGALVERSRKIMKDARAVEPAAGNVAIYRQVSERYLAVRDSLRDPLLARQRPAR